MTRLDRIKDEIDRMFEYREQLLTDVKRNNNDISERVNARLQELSDIQYKIEEIIEETL